MTATWDTTWTQLAGAVKAVEDLRSNFVTSYAPQEAAVQAGVDLDIRNTSAMTGGLAGLRARLVGSLQEGGRGIATPHLSELARIMKLPPGDGVPFFERLARYMIDNPDGLTGPPRIRSRQFVRGAWSAAGGNTGNGTVHRLTVDEDGIPLEASFADVLSFRCTLDRQMGARPGREAFEVRGLPRRDRLDDYQSGFGSGIYGSLNAFSADDSQQLLLNPSFADYTGTSISALSALNNWTLTSGVIGSLTLTETTGEYYRKADLETTARALKVAGSVALQQKISTRSGSLLAGTPYFLQIAWNAELGTFVGTLQVTVGSKSYSVVISGQTGWQKLVVDLDKFCFLKNFNTDDLAVTVTVTRTSGTLHIDDLVWRPFVRVNGTWVAIVGGSTPWKYNDAGTITDTEPGGANAKLARWFHALYDAVPPVAEPSPTTAPSAALAGAGAGNLSNGAYGYKVTFVGPAGESGPSGAGSVTVTDAATDGKVNLSAIPTGTASVVTARKVYRTTAGGGTYKLLTTIADNSTTTYLDNTADGSLGANLTAVGVTIAEPA